jgi:hypothetical protein
MKILTRESTVYVERDTDFTLTYASESKYSDIGGLPDPDLNLDEFDYFLKFSPGGGYISENNLTLYFARLNIFTAQSLGIEPNTFYLIGCDGLKHTSTPDHAESDYALPLDVCEWRLFDAEFRAPRIMDSSDFNQINCELVPQADTYQLMKFEQHAVGGLDSYFFPAHNSDKLSVGPTRLHDGCVLKNDTVEQLGRDGNGFGCETVTGFFSRYGVNSLCAPYAYKFAFVQGSDVIWSQDLNYENCYTVIPPSDDELKKTIGMNWEALDETCVAYVFWSYASIPSSAAGTRAKICLGTWTPIKRTADGVFTLEEPGIYGVSVRSQELDQESAVSWNPVLHEMSLELDDLN